MTTRTAGEGAGYWYGGKAEPGSVDVLNALRDYRASEAAMRRRTRSSMGMGETDLLALRYLLQAQQSGKPGLGSKELGARLGISSASMTTLIDRLSKSGHVERRPHPTDRRALIVAATGASNEEVRETLGAMHQRMMAAAATLSPQEALTVIEFLRRMSDAVDAVEEHGDGR